MKKGRTKLKTLKKITHASAPASVGLLRETRGELKADIRAVDLKIDRVYAKIEHLDAKIEQKFQESVAIGHRCLALLEEQRSENRIVLDGLKLVLDRMDTFEARF